MRQKIIKQLIGAGILFGISGMVFYLTENILYAGATFAVIFLIYVSGDWFLAYCRERTMRFFANVGSRTNSSIIPDDILRLPSTYDKDINYYCFRPGGSSVYYAPFHGMGDIYIIKSDIVNEEDGSVLARGDWCILEFDNLPSSWQNIILAKFKEDRLIPFSPNRHNIFYAETYTPIKDIDKKMHNLDTALRASEQEKLINSLRKQINDLQTIMMSNVSLIKGFKSIDEERETPKQKIRYVPVKAEE